MTKSWNCISKNDQIHSNRFHLGRFFSHIINLLTNMPTTCFEELLSPAVSEDDPNNDEHNGKNMEAINVILRFLDQRLTKVEVKTFRRPFFSSIDFSGFLFRPENIQKKHFFLFFNFSSSCVNRIQQFENLLVN